MYYIPFQIRDETDTKIDLPSENADSDVIVITGKKANVEKAKKMIEDIQKDLVCVIITFVKKIKKFLIWYQGLN